MTIVRANLETGDLSEFDYTEIDGGDLSAEAGVGRFGAYGLQAVIDDTTRLRAFIYESIGTEFWFALNFKIDAAFSQANGNAMHLVNVMNTVSTKNIFYSYLNTKTTPSGVFGYYAVAAREVGGGLVVPGTGNASQSLEAGQWHHFEWHWKRSSASGEADGQFDFWLNGVLIGSDHAINFGTDAVFDSYDARFFRIDMTSIVAGTSGKLYFDDIVLSNEGRIRPAGNPRRRRILCGA